MGDPAEGPRRASQGSGAETFDDGFVRSTVLKADNEKTDPLRRALMYSPDYRQALDEAIALVHAEAMAPFCLYTLKPIPDLSQIEGRCCTTNPRPFWPDPIHHRSVARLEGALATAEEFSLRWYRLRIAHNFARLLADIDATERAAMKGAYPHECAATVDQVAAQALELGQLLAEATLAAKHKSDAQTRRKARTHLAEGHGGGREAHNRRQAEEAEAKRQEVLQIAEQLQASNPSLSNSRLAQLIEHKLKEQGIGWSAHSIRRALGKKHKNTRRIRKLSTHVRG